MMGLGVGDPSYQVTVALDFIVEFFTLFATAILRFSQRTNPDDEILFFPASGVDHGLAWNTAIFRSRYHNSMSWPSTMLSPIAARGVEKEDRAAS